MAARTADEAVRLALSFVGQTESPAGSNRFTLPDGRTLWETVGLAAYDHNAGGGKGQPYCGGGAWYCIGAEAAGVPAATFAYTPAAIAAYRTKGWMVTTPQAGDVAWMNFSGGRTPEHVELVVALNRDSSVATVGWNTSPGDAGSQANGGGVFRRTRPAKVIVGYGRPAYNTAPAAPPTTPPPAPPADWTEEALVALPTLARGAKGHHVRILQGLLIVHAGDLMDEKDLDGDFGPNTETVLRTWQARTNSLAADGVCGPATWRWLIGA